MLLSATTTTTPSIELHQSAQCHITDDIEGVTIPVDEWIAKELARIKEKQEPRHCHDYEALIEVIEEISRMPTSMMMTTMKQQRNYNTDTTTTNNNDLNYVEDDDDTNGSAITSPCANHLDSSSMLLLLPSPPISPIISSSSMMVLLGRSFISLWKYCWDDQYAPHHPYPVGLLLDIEKITLRLHSNRIDTNNNNNNNYNNNNNNNNNKNNKNNNTNNNNDNNNNNNHEMMNSHDGGDGDIPSENNQHGSSSEEKSCPRSMQSMIQAQLSKAFYIQTPPPPGATPSCFPWLSSFQVIQQWIFPLSIPEASSSLSSTSYLFSDTVTTTGWYSSFITGMDAYRSAKASLPFASNFSHPSLPVITTVDHLEQLMQKTHI